MTEALLTLFAQTVPAVPITVPTTVVESAASHGMSALIGSLGPSGGVVVVVLYFLRYCGRRDAAQRVIADETTGRMEKIVDRVEKMEDENRTANKEIADGFSTAVKEMQAEYRRTVDSLIEVHKSTGSTIGAVSGRVNDLAAKVAEMAGQVGKMADVAGDLARKVERLDAAATVRTSPAPTP